MKEYNPLKKYVLLEVTGIDQWGGRPDVKPVAYADTEEELQDLCDRMGYTYKDTSYPSHYIQSTESYMGELERKRKDDYSIAHPILSTIRLRGIPYEDLLYIFDSDNMDYLSEFKQLGRIMEDSNYPKTFTNMDGDELHQIEIKDISGVETKLTIKIPKKGNNNPWCIDAVMGHLTSLRDPFTGIKTYHGLAGVVLTASMRNELFKFELVFESILEDGSSRYKNFYTDGIISCVQSNKDDHIIEFVLFGGIHQ